LETEASAMLIAIAILLALPVGLFILWRSSRVELWVKLVITVVLFLACLIMFFKPSSA
jgi:hypothetical protein